LAKLLRPNIAARRSSRRDAELNRLASVLKVSPTFCLAGAVAMANISLCDTQELVPLICKAVVISGHPLVAHRWEIQGDKKSCTRIVRCLDVFLKLRCRIAPEPRPVQDASPYLK